MKQIGEMGLNLNEENENKSKNGNKSSNSSSMRMTLLNHLMKCLMMLKTRRKSWEKRRAILKSKRIREMNN